MLSVFRNSELNHHSKVFKQGTVEERKERLKKKKKKKRKRQKEPAMKHEENDKSGLEDKTCKGNTLKKNLDDDVHKGSGEDITGHIDTEACLASETLTSSLNDGNNGKRKKRNKKKKKECEQFRAEDVVDKLKKKKTKRLKQRWN